MGGSRRKTRDKLRRSPKEKGKISIRQYLQKLEEDDRVLLKINSSVHKGLFYPRFHGKTGTVMGKDGECYTVHIVDGKKHKMLYVHPAHLRKV